MLFLYPFRKLFSFNLSIWQITVIYLLALNHPWIPVINVIRHLFFLALLCFWGIFNINSLIKWALTFLPCIPLFWLWFQSYTSQIVWLVVPPIFMSSGRFKQGWNDMFLEWLVEFSGKPFSPAFQIV